MARKIDHYVLPVRTLAESRARYEALGFTVNKDGIHPFGTANACVFLADGTYLEPLAVHDPIEVTNQMTKNSFVMMDQRFRAECGSEGLSAIALATDDIETDERAFHAAGYDAPSRLAFSRRAISDTGETFTLSVDGAFCLNAEHPAFGMFTCQWLGEKKIIEKIRQAPAHENTVTGIESVSLTAEHLERAKRYLTVGLDGCFKLVDDHSEVLTLDNGDVFLKSGNGPLCATSMTFIALDLSSVRSCFDKNDVIFKEQCGQLHVPPSAGQGITMVFKQGD